MRKAFFIIALIVFTMCSFGTRSENQTKITIVASNEILAAIAKEIGGVYVKVDWILPPGATPHDYSPTPEDIEKLKNADLVIFANTSFFSLESKLKEHAEGKLIVDYNDYTTNNVTLIEIPNFGINIHAFWLYPDNALAIAKAIKEKLQMIDSLHADYYSEKLTEFSERIAKLKNDLINIAKKVGLYSSGAVVSVPGAAYVVLAFGIKVEATLAGGPQTTLNASLMNDLIRKAKEGKIKAVFCPESLKNTNIDDATKQFSEDAGIPILYIRIFSIGGIMDYFSLMEYNAGVVETYSSSSTNISEERIAILYTALTIIALIAILEGFVIYKLRKNIEKMFEE